MRWRRAHLITVIRCAGRKAPLGPPGHKSCAGKESPRPELSGNRKSALEFAARNRFTFL
jgi:hypothetical protein